MLRPRLGAFVAGALPVEGGELELVVSLVAPGSVGAHATVRSTPAASSTAHNFLTCPPFELDPTSCASAAALQLAGPARAGAKPYSGWPRFPGHPQRSARS